MTSKNRPYFSKFKLITGWQCQKMLYLDRHHPDLADESNDRQAKFDVGNRVGKMAQEECGTTDSVEIPYNRDTKGRLQKLVQALHCIDIGGNRLVTTCISSVYTTRGAG